MKLLAEILGMTNFCNLRCTYCDWKMRPIERLSEEGRRAAAARIGRIGELVAADYPSVVFVEYSGGEPFVYPAIVEALLDTFPDRWVRISTNGTLIRPQHIERLAGRKAYLAMSLDGHTQLANLPRFGNSATLLARVGDTLSALLAAGVPTMLLCTLNQANIDGFPAFVEHLTATYPEAIQNGLLMLPAHCVSEYDKENGKPTIAQAYSFLTYVLTRAAESPLIAPIWPHYLRLAEFIIATTCKSYRESGRQDALPPAWRARYPHDGSFARTCFLHDWQVCFHFLDDAIATSGSYRSFGCGMRGVGDLGLYQIDKKESVEAHRQAVHAGSPSFRAARPLGGQCPLLEDCLVDWNAIDMIFSGQIDLESAQSWSLMFRDPAVSAAVRLAQAEYAGAPAGAAVDSAVDSATKPAAKPAA
ncbi:MAG TPA: radical SAM protein [Pseudomonadota bacterium]|nr:radical SAM protein [Pseudomonadota bacterium]